VDHEFPLNCLYGAAHPWILGRQKADERDQQQTRIELAVAKALRESVALAVKPQPADRRVHAVAEFSPGFQRRLEIEPLRIAHRPIQTPPRLDLGKGEMAATASHFPDSFIRLFPDLVQMFDQLLLQRPSRPDGSKTKRSPLVDGVDKLAVHIELK